MQYQLRPANVQGRSAKHQAAASLDLVWLVDSRSIEPVADELPDEPENRRRSVALSTFKKHDISQNT